jgi:hypothetical protein
MYPKIAEGEILLCIMTVLNCVLNTVKKWDNFPDQFTINPYTLHLKFKHTQGISKS